jgi:hypothetical protein
MNAGTALAALQALAQWAATSWMALAAGLVAGGAAGFLVGRLLPARRQPRPRSGFAHDLLALTPAIVACLLWGAWLGIMAAKFAP